MRDFAALFLGIFSLSYGVCWAQQAPTHLPDAPDLSISKSANSDYARPTQEERFKSYLRQTYGVKSILEAGAHAGIAQARDHPSEWPQGAEGYADRFGSAMGEHAVRGTTEYLLADLLREDIRHVHCSHPCSVSRFKIAFENTFLARRGDDGHEAFSVARFIGPFSGGIVAVNTWYPAGSTGANIFREAGVSFGLRYIRNLIW
ncbi:hypothetical protein [Occallatibacter riparius]|uniref:Uncharacterized protein n=1 Tax=Occallatibacter riparius TaxID=1002689 RepID=A0A9J7BPH5_9BACT|nr:hypothetical protein [Occallatibacter riparius]UWZ82830.1 hypothetical protein MOP44_19950 [Occallatibacter riparius]